MKLLKILIFCPDFILFCSSFMKIHWKEIAFSILY